jgi:hypothetical protein
VTTRADLVRLVRGISERDPLTDEEVDDLVDRFIARDLKAQQQFEEMTASYEDFVTELAAQFVLAAEQVPQK